MPTFVNLKGGGASFVTQAEGTIVEGQQGPFPGMASVSFSGTGARAQAGDIHRFNGVAAFSVEFWFLLTATTTGNPRMVTSEFTDGGGDQGWSVEFNGAPGTVYWVRRLNSVGDFCNFGTFVPGKWHHLVCTFDGTNMRGYLDTVLGDTTPSTASIVNSAVNLRIGAYGSTSPSVNGRMAGTAIYGVALSLDEVRARFRTGKRRDWAAWRRAV